MGGGDCVRISPGANWPDARMSGMGPKLLALLRGSNADGAGPMLEPLRRRPGEGVRCWPCMSNMGGPAMLPAAGRGSSRQGSRSRDGWRRRMHAVQVPRIIHAWHLLLSGLWVSSTQGRANP